MEAVNCTCAFDCAAAWLENTACLLCSPEHGCATDTAGTLCATSASSRLLAAPALAASSWTLKTSQCSHNLSVHQPDLRLQCHMTQQAKQWLQESRSCWRVTMHTDSCAFRVTVCKSGEAGVDDLQNKASRSRLAQHKTTDSLEQSVVTKK